MKPQKRRDIIAQWAFDTRPVLGRFHLWLEDVELRRVAGEDGESFVGPALERALVTAAAVTALGTQLFGRFGEGKGLDKAGINRVKKDADAISAYAMSESLWYLTRNLPENHAVLVSLGEGLMPKAGETPEMGSNPLLGFGRVYARPMVAKKLDRLIHRLINRDEYGWEGFWRDVQEAGITVWGAAIDTLENTSRFAKGESTGPLTVLHLFDQPLCVASPYEGYVSNLILPREVVEKAAQQSVLISHRTPRRKVLEAILDTWPDVAAERVHIWTLGGPARETRLGDLWREWREAGVHLVEDGWTIPGGGEVFVDSGTYAPTYRVGRFTAADGETHVFLCDGYAASAEAIQAASLDEILDTHTSMGMLSSAFKVSMSREAEVMALDPDSPTFGEDLKARAGKDLGDAVTEQYRGSIRDAARAGMPVDRPVVTIDDFLPLKSWRMISVAGFMLDDPYSGCPGIEKLDDATYRVTVRAANRHRIDEIRLTLRLMESLEESRLVFSPLLDRFYATREYGDRPVKISDSGRIRNELQTLCLEALEHFGDDGIRVHFDRIDDAVLSPDKRRFIREVLEWYQTYHPTWFRWLELA